MDYVFVVDISSSDQRRDWLDFDNTLNCRYHLSFFSNFSREKSVARRIQSRRIFFHCSFFMCFTTYWRLLIPEAGSNISISFPVVGSYIVSLRPHSLAPITGVPQAIDSTGAIPKSSSMGIYIVAVAHWIRRMSSVSSGDSRARILSFPAIRARILSFSGSFFP